MGQKLVRPEKGKLACDLVTEREWGNYVKKAKRLAKICSITIPTGGRLQLEEWQKILNEKRVVI